MNYYSVIDTCSENYEQGQEQGETSEELHFKAISV